MDQSSEILPLNSSAPEAIPPTQELPTAESQPAPPEAVPAAVAPEVGGNKINKVAQSQQAAAPPLSLPPVVNLPVTTDNVVQNIVGPIPVIADDVDVIEKEWVDKAKKIVEQTKTDPYRQEQAVEQLQRSYLKKRYNKDLKNPNN